MSTNPAPVLPTPIGAASPIDNGPSLILQGLPTPFIPEGFDGVTSGGLLPDGPGVVPPSASAPVAGTGLVGSTGLASGGSLYDLPTTNNSLNFNNILGVGVNSQPVSQPVPPQPPVVSEQTYQSYSGSDMRVMLTLSDPTGRGQNLTKQLVEVTTLTVSIHRVKSPARACGYINPRGFARHGRTIAGTIILTQFTLDVMTRFLYGQQSTDLSKDSFYLKCDQLPPFDLTLMFCDEYGNSSTRRLLGVDIVDDGTIYSSNDMFAEQTLSYMAADFTPLAPVNNPALMTPDPNSVAAATQRTPMMVMPVPCQTELSLINPQSTVTPAVASKTTATPSLANASEDPSSYGMPYEGED